MRANLLIFATMLLALAGCGGKSTTDTDIEAQETDALTLIKTLSSDELQGRATGTAGGNWARGIIKSKFEAVGRGEVTEQAFAIADFSKDDPSHYATNLYWTFAGKTPGSGPILVVTAHYDHVGIRDGEIHNGADDNASGVGALYAIGKHFAANPPQHDVLLAALDAEELGFHGARALFNNGPLDQDRVALNINLDMISRSDVGELYVAGVYHTPTLKPFVDELTEAASVTLIMGHDSPDLGKMDDWTHQSDHVVFHQAGIPFLYFGVESHPDYHKPTDDYDNINKDFTIRSIETLVMAAEAADKQLTTLGTPQ